MHFMLVDVWVAEFVPYAGLPSLLFRLDRIDSGSRLPRPEPIRIHFRRQRGLCRSSLAPRLVDSLLKPIPFFTSAD